MIDLIESRLMTMSSDRCHDLCSEVSEVVVSVDCHATSGAVEGKATCALVIQEVR